VVLGSRGYRNPPEPQPIDSRPCIRRRAESGRSTFEPRYVRAGKSEGRRAGGRRSAGGPGEGAHRKAQPAAAQKTRLPVYSISLPPPVPWPPRAAARDRHAALRRQLFISLLYLPNVLPLVITEAIELRSARGCALIPLSCLVRMAG
jgi:hypothetical protein